MVTDVLMSIRPVHSEAIFAGTKTVELRRRRPSFPAGTRVLVYSSSPERRVDGAFEVGRVIEDDPGALWAAIGDRSGVDRAAFEEYFAGCQTAFAIEVEKPRRIRPTRLSIRPPQSYQFLRPQHAALRRLLGIAGA